MSLVPRIARRGISPVRCVWLVESGTNRNFAMMHIPRDMVPVVVVVVMVSVRLRRLCKRQDRRQRDQYGRKLHTLYS
jgi:hypothetical protein